VLRDENKQIITDDKKIPQGKSFGRMINTAPDWHSVRNASSNRGDKPAACVSEKNNLLQVVYFLLLRALLKIKVKTYSQI
jgi:hypothetical protein